MLFDKQLMFDEDVALTATRNSTNVIDLLIAGQDLGRGEELYLMFCVTTILDSSGEGATLQIALTTDSNPNLATAAVTLQDEVAVITEAELVAGYQIFRRFHPSPAMKRYLGIIYTVGSENFTSGKITCGLVKDIQSWKSFSSNYVSA